MAYAKITFDGQTLIDLTNDTVDGNKMLAGYTAHSSSGSIVTGAIGNGSITNNTSGGSSSGTINRGKQIKIGKGYYPSDIYYTAQSGDTTYSVTSSVSNGSSNSYNATKSVSGGKLVLAYTPNSGYKLPSSSSSITVSGATKSYWDRSYGVLGLSNVTSNISVSFSCVQSSTVTIGSGFYSDWYNYCYDDPQRIQVVINGTAYSFSTSMSGRVFTDVTSCLIRISDYYEYWTISTSSSDYYVSSYETSISVSSSVTLTGISK